MIVEDFLILMRSKHLLKQCFKKKNKYVGCGGTSVTPALWEAKAGDYKFKPSLDNAEI